MTLLDTVELLKSVQETLKCGHLNMHFNVPKALFVYIPLMKSEHLTNQDCPKVVQTREVPLYIYIACVIISCVTDVHCH